jgi:type II secretory pathway pseudopilin PulG
LRNRAYTLVELLVAIGILILLIGIVAPALVSAKVRAREANDVSNLRQLGQAGALYHDQFGEMPLGCPVLVTSRMVPSSLCSGARDSSSRGIANMYADAHAAFSPSYKSVKTTYKNSYLGWRELMTAPDKLEQQLAPAANNGWLVDLASAIPSDPFGHYWRGTYRRLLLDGSVTSRQTRMVTAEIDGKPQQAFMMITLFGDFAPEWTPGKF